MDDKNGSKRYSRDSEGWFHDTNKEGSSDAVLENTHGEAEGIKEHGQITHRRGGGNSLFISLPLGLMAMVMYQLGEFYNIAYLAAIIFGLVALLAFRRGEKSKSS